MNNCFGNGSRYSNNIECLRRYVKSDDILKDMFGI